MPPRKFRKGGRRPARNKPGVKKMCIEEEEPLKEDFIIDIYKSMIKAIKPTMKDLKKSMKIHLWKQEHEFENTIFGRLQKMHDEMAFFQIENERFKRFLKNLLKTSKEDLLRISNALDAVNLIHSKRLMILGGLEIGPYLNFNDFIKDIGSSAPMWMGGMNEVAPPFCGAIPPPDNYVFMPGHMVAAHVITDDAEQEVHPELGIIGKWILCVVIEGKEQFFTIRDMDGSGTLYKVPKIKLIPLPLFIPDPETNPEAIYPVKSLVLALYTGTTCFFPGIVIGTPQNKEEHYSIRFRDSNDDSGWGGEMKVEQQFVIPYRDVYTIVSDEEQKHLISIFGDVAVMPLKKPTCNIADNNNVPIDEE